MSNDETLRAPNGRWKKGTPSPNPSGKPKKIAEVQGEYLAAMYDEVPLDQWRQTVNKWRAKADQDFDVFKFFAAHLQGQPTQRLTVNDDEEQDINLSLPTFSLSDGDESDGAQ